MFNSPLWGKLLWTFFFICCVFLWVWHILMPESFCHITLDQSMYYIQSQLWKRILFLRPLDDWSPKWYFAIDREPFSKLLYPAVFVFIVSVRCYLLLIVGTDFSVTEIMFESEVNRTEKHAIAPISKWHAVKRDLNVNFSLSSWDSSNSFHYWLVWRA